MPVNATRYYADRCLSCHRGKLAATHPSTESDCISCHMPRRPVSDGGHTVFTDHRIMRSPEAVSPTAAAATDLAAWREPPSSFAKRNLALAYVAAGLTRHYPAWIVRGYRMLTEVQTSFSTDVDVLNALGTALLQGRQPQEAKFAFDRVVALNPTNAAFQENAGRADLACGNIELAVKHLEKALDMDPLLLSAAGVLQGIYRNKNDAVKEAALAERVHQALKNGTASTRP
jgi:tetratricopeptide (TPR) repeat protein